MVNGFHPHHAPMPETACHVDHRVENPVMIARTTRNLLSKTGFIIGLALAALEVPSQEVYIQSLAGNGALTWTNPISPSTGFRVEWAPSVTAAWQKSWETLVDIPATNSVTERRVPMFYRVVSYPLATQLITNVPAALAFQILTNHLSEPDFIIIDVRTPSEFAGGHIKTALNVNYYYAAFADTLAKLNPKLTYMVYCASGNRSRLATEQLRLMNFMNVYNLSEGYGVLASQPGAAGYTEK
jgi:rhodanese-related sulfurtransferase